MDVLRRLVVLSRPKGALLIPLLPILSLFFAHWDRALRFESWSTVLILFGAWLSLHCGTMWLNALLDQDQGEILFGEACTVPQATGIAAYLGLFVAVILSALLGLIPLLLTTICAGLAILYSHSRSRWKAHSLGGPFVNVIGYGVCSPLIGWWVAGVTVNLRTMAVLGTIPPFVLGCYLIAQSFQGDEDRERGYKTLVVTHGVSTAILMAYLCFHLVFIQFIALAVVGGCHGRFWLWSFHISYCANFWSGGDKHHMWVQRSGLNW